MISYFEIFDVLRIRLIDTIEFRIMLKSVNVIIF